MYKTGSKLSQAKMVRDIQLKSNNSYDKVDNEERLKLLIQKQRKLDDILFNMPKDHPAYKEYAQEAHVTVEQIRELKPKKIKKNYWYTFAMVLKEHDKQLYYDLEKKAQKRHNELTRR